MTGKQPFGGFQGNLTAHILAGHRETMPSHVAPVFRDLIQACWAHAPHDRPKLTTLIDRLTQYRYRPPSPDAATCYQLGVQCESQQDDEAAQSYYQRAIDKGGYAKAYTNLGLFHLTGKGRVALDKAQAARYFEKAAEQHHGRALINLGQMLEYGDGVAQDLPRAKQCYQALIEQAQVKKKKKTWAHHKLQRITEKMTAQANNNNAPLSP